MTGPSGPTPVACPMCDGRLVPLGLPSGALMIDMMDGLRRSAGPSVGFRLSVDEAHEMAARMEAYLVHQGWCLDVLDDPSARVFVYSDDL